MSGGNGSVETAARGSPPAPAFAFVAEDVKRQRRIARELLSEAEAVGRLLESEMAALGTDEIAFLKRLHAGLLARAEELDDNAADTALHDPQARRRAPKSRKGVEMDDEQLYGTQARETGREDARGPLELVRVVVVCYLMFLFAYLGYLFAKSHLLRVDVAGEIMDMFQIFLLPTVMLVLGYFFGASRR